MFLVYYTILIPNLLCTQSLSQISAILFTRNIPSAMLISQVIIQSMALLSNGLIPVKAMHYSIQMLSELSFMKFTHDFIILNMYGLGSCHENQISTVLYAFSITDDMYWPIINKMIINVVLFKILKFAVFIYKFNSLSESKTKRTNSLITNLNSKNNLL